MSSWFATGAPESFGATRPHECGQDGVTCSRLSVPLDWSGKQPGKISLQVEVYRPKGVSRGAMFLMAGGPGQASTQFFDLGRYSSWAELFRGYTLVSFDPRGTGFSSPLRCAASRYVPTEVASYASLIARCAHQLGAKRNYFGTNEVVGDIDAIRRELGFSRIGLYGASYGTSVALTYARTFPTHVQRLLLDSVATPRMSAPVVASVMRKIPATLTRYCAGVCVGITPDYAHEVVALANSTSSHPLRGLVVEPDGAQRSVTLWGDQLLGMVFETDLNPGLAAELPAAVHAARLGDVTPLLRLESLLDPAPQSGSYDPLFVATTCDDGPLPWQPTASLAERTSVLAASQAGFSKQSLGGFGNWAFNLGNAGTCLGWPASAAAAAPPHTSYPDVPVLAITGNFDIRTPGADARAVLRHFPHGHLLTIANAGHSAMSATSTRCVDAAVLAWVRGAAIAATCRNVRALDPVRAVPAASGPPTTTANTLSLIEQTLDDAKAISTMHSYGDAPAVVAGVQAGRLSVSGRGLTLSGYTLAGGLALTGNLTVDQSYGAAATSVGGVVHAKDGFETIGTLAVNNGRLTGELDGRTVVDSKVLPATGSRSISSAQGWSDWVPAASASNDRVTREIAQHVSSEYRLTQGGPALVKVIAGGRSPFAKSRVLSQLGVQYSDTDSDAQLEYRSLLNSRSYTLCGSGAECSIGSGAATATRGQLVRREALELALDTFEFEPAVSSILVYLPPPPGEPQSSAIYFERSQLSGPLSRPLDVTLKLASTPLPAQADKSEATTIDGLTLGRTFSVEARKLGDGSAELDLYPW